jgi:ER-bound oxygenase mpaB/B'/Rubber oxygenase, catalytic domain
MPTLESGARDGAEGYFPRGRSVVRRVHGERVVGSLYGQRALLVQACHPLAFAGLNATTHGYDASFRRLARTAKAMETIYFATRAEADRESAARARPPCRVRGALTEPAGRHPAGSTYRADSPELLLWILACLADSAQAACERFVRALSPSERRALLGGLPGPRRAVRASSLRGPAGLPRLPRLHARAAGERRPPRAAPGARDLRPGGFRAAATGKASAHPPRHQPRRGRPPPATGPQPLRAAVDPRARAHARVPRPRFEDATALHTTCGAARPPGSTTWWRARARRAGAACG